MKVWIVSFSGNITAVFDSKDKAEDYAAAHLPLGSTTIKMMKVNR
jgi:hypothetical protein